MRETVPSFRRPRRGLRRSRRPRRRGGAEDASRLSQPRLSRPRCGDLPRRRRVGVSADARSLRSSGARRSPATIPGRASTTTARARTSSSSPPTRSATGRSARAAWPSAIEESGSSAAVRKTLDAAELGDAKTVERTRETAGKMVPWFKMTGYEPIDPVLVFWVMEYSPSFLKEWHPELRPGTFRHRAKAGPRALPGEGRAHRSAEGSPLLRTSRASVSRSTPRAAESFGKRARRSRLPAGSEGRERFLARSGRAHRRSFRRRAKSAGSSPSTWP